MEKYNIQPSNDIKFLILSILHNPKIIDQNYDLIVNELKENNINSIYLTALLDYLNISSEYLDLLRKRNNLNLIISLHDNIVNNNNTDSNDADILNTEQEDLIFITEPPRDYKPVDEETALKMVFVKNEYIDLPPENEIKNIQEKFAFIDDKDNKRKLCVRKYVINSTGRVIVYGGERIKELNVENDVGYYDGQLSQLITDE